jgi:hypothetical protein
MSVGRLSTGAGLSAGALVVPVSPASVSVGSGSATVSGNGQVSFSGASSVSINNCFTSTYDNYKIIFNFYGSANSAVNLRLRAGGSDLAGTGYTRQRSQTDGTAYTGNRGASQGFWDFGATRGNTTYNSYEMLMLNPSNSLTKSIIYNGYDLLSGGTIEFGGGHNTVASVYDGMTIYPTAGNFTGTIRVYGYANGA